MRGSTESVSGGPQLRKLNLSQRLFLITLVALMPTVAILAYNLAALRQTQRQEIHAEAFRIAQLVTLEMSQIVTGTENLLRAVASAPVVRRSDSPGCSQYVASMVEQLPQYVSIAVIDGSGVLQCSPAEAGAGVFLGDRSYFAEVLQTGKLVIGEFNEGRVSKRASLPIAIPLLDSAGWSDGIVVAGLDLDWLGAQLRNREFAPRSAITIADRNGRILAREPLPEDFVGTTIPDDFQHLVKGDAPGTLELTSQDGTRRVIGYFPADADALGLYVSAGLSTEAAFAALDAATRRGALIALASVVVAFSLSWSTSNAFIRRPIGQLLTTIDKWRREDLSARTRMTGREGELGEVGASIDGFMDELVAARALRRKAERQRELLLGELDHRVKNLLATVQAVARQSFRSPERSENANVFLSRLAIMGDAHSLLMRDEWQEATVAELVASATAPFNDQQHPQFNVSGPPFTLNSRAVLALGMALHELCTNAVKYGALQTQSGRVDVRWDVAPGEDGTFLLKWTERGGPPVAAPRGKGFGSRMIEEALAQQIGGEVAVAYDPDGVVCTVTAPSSVVGSQRPDTSFVPRSAAE